MSEEQLPPRTCRKCGCATFTYRTTIDHFVGAEAIEDDGSGGLWVADPGACATSMVSAWYICNGCHARAQRLERLTR